MSYWMKGDVSCSVSSWRQDLVVPALSLYSIDHMCLISYVTGSIVRSPPGQPAGSHARVQDTNSTVIMDSCVPLARITALINVATGIIVNVASLHPLW